jgi:hypothetical protein
MQGYRDKKQRKALFIWALRGRAKQQSSKATEQCEAPFSCEVGEQGIEP